MAFEAVSHGGNPFLMDEDFSLPVDNGASNPFLTSGDFDMPSNGNSAELNPFLCGLEEDYTDTNSAGSTNPFAMFGDEDMDQSFIAVNNDNIFGDDNLHSNTINLFGDDPEPQAEVQNQVSNVDFFGSPEKPTPPRPSPPIATLPSLPLTGEAVEYCAETANIFQVEEDPGKKSPASGPGRPPPPRPVPPSKETQQLILSVTGAMEATSSDLLDRLRATKTPSPTPIRDLHSPSPTPELGGDFLGEQEGDLMIGEEAAAPAEPQTAANFMDIFGGGMEERVITPPELEPQDFPPPPNETVEQTVAPNTGNDFFNMFGNEDIPATTAPVTAPATGPPPRPPAPPVIIKPVTPPQEGNLLGDFSSPNTTEVREIIETPVPVVTKPPPPKPAPPRIPPRPPSPNVPVSSPAIHAEQEPAPAFQNSKPVSSAYSQSVVETAAFTSPPATVNAFTSPPSAVNAFTSPPPAVNAFTSPPAATNAFISPPAAETSMFITPPAPESNMFSTEPATETNMFSTEPTSENNMFSSETATETNMFSTEPTTENNMFSSKPGADMFSSEPGADMFSSEPAPETAMFTSAPTTEVSQTYQAPEVNYNAFNHTEVPQSSGGFGAALFGDFAPSNDRQNDDFDAFAAKFESAGSDFSMENNQGSEKKDPFFDAFGASVGGVGDNSGAWGNDANDNGAKTLGFGGDEDQFDAFLSLAEPPPVPQHTPARNTRQESADSDEGDNLKIVIKPKMGGADELSSRMQLQGPVPILAPPPRSPEQSSAFADNTPRFNPFDSQGQGQAEVAVVPATIEATPAAPPARPPDMGVTFQRTDSQETPQTPLFDEDVSQPLEEFPRVNYVGEGWEMHLRHPNKKKITGQRFWKKVFVRLVYQGDNPVMQLSNTKEDKDPFQELPLQPCYSISDIGAQQFDQYGKIFTVKLQYVFYKERPGVRPGQVTKAERITNKLSQFAAYAIQGDYQGVKEFGSDLRKLGLPVEHAPQISQLLKIGSQNYEDMKQFSITVEEALFRMPAHRDRALNYKMEEVQITAVDELYLEQDMTGHVCKQIARVRVFFLGFISGMPDLELGVNDIMRQGKEVVGRHDIIPVVTEEWIRLENLEFHSCVLNNEYEGARVIKFKPPDACYIELLRFRVRPPKNRELPLQLKCVICVTGNKVEIKCDILVPGFSSRKLGQIPCEDIMVRIPIPESWIYLFRVEKHFRYGSVKSAHRRTGKIKGIERFLGTMETMEQSLIEVTSGSAKYEHQHHAIVWRIARLPKEGQGAYTNHEFVCRFQLTSFDQIPDELAKYCYLEFTMPSTQVSHTTVRSLSVLGDRDEDPPEKCVRHLARLEYRIEIEHTQGSSPNSYLAATQVKSTPEPVIEKPEPEKDSDSDSSS